MNKLLLSFFAMCGILATANAQNVNIPDANFKAYLVGNSNINTNGDTEIQVSEAESIIYLNLSSVNIADLTGVEAFINLTTLRAGDNLLTSIDVSQNTELLVLNVANNQLTSIDVSQNTELLGLNVANNQLTSIDVSQNLLLTGLSCGENNISTLNVSLNTELITLTCNTNNISVLDLSQNTALIALNCKENNLSTLDLSNTSINQNTTLEIPYINCEQNNLTSLKMNNISTNSLEGQYFHATSNPNLTCIEVDDVAEATAAWTNIDATASFSTNCFPILIASIDVQGQGGVSTISTLGGTLQMEATVSPSNADDDTYTWSVANGTGTATISTSGLLTATTDGTVTVTATANDGSGITGDAIITISNQNVGINEQSEIQNLSIYPNPVKSELNFDFNEEAYGIHIVDVIGKTISTISNPNNSIDVSYLTKGIYFLQIHTSKGLVSTKFIKE